MRLTPEQIEAAARKLCELRNWDWREDISDGRRGQPEMALDVAKDEIRAHLEIQEAIESISQSSLQCCDGECLYAKEGAD